VVAIGLDVDCYEEKTGAADLARLFGQWGPLPPTWKTTSRDDGSGILLYRVPSGVDPTNWHTGAGPSIEIIRHAHRYAVVWPSIHPETGQPYRWYRPDGTLADDARSPVSATGRTAGRVAGRAHRARRQRRPCQARIPSQPPRNRQAGTSVDR
jgi:Bifunctional DNA primase/polymerase, N-terminal